MIETANTQYSLNDVYRIDSFDARTLPKTVIYQVRQAVCGELSPVVLSFVTNEERSDWVRAHDRLDVLKPVALEGVELWYALRKTKNFLSACDPKRIPVD